MPTTPELRSWWGPACTGPLTRVGLNGQGFVSVASRIVSAVQALNACLIAHGYSTRKADTGAYNCRTITGGTGYSLHAYGIALDINWQSNPYGPTLITDMPSAMVAAIKGIRTKNGKQVWRWGGNYTGNKDAMHYEIVCHPLDIATGINPATVPGGVVIPPKPPTPPTPGPDKLLPGKALGQGDALVGGQYRFVHQGDGNLVVYEGTRVVWHSGTHGQKSDKLQMQGDGHLVLYGPTGTVIWKSNTAGNPGAWLAMQGDGNLVLYSASHRPLWVNGVAFQPGNLAFPLPNDHWFGPESNDAQNHSGYSAADRPGISAIRNRLRERGLAAASGDRYNVELAEVVKRFQRDNGLGVDGLVGRQTWDSLW